VFASIDAIKVTVSKGYDGKYEVKREPATTWGQFTPEHVFYLKDGDENITQAKCAYIWENITYGDTFTIVRNCPPAVLLEWKNKLVGFNFEAHRNYIYGLLEKSDNSSNYESIEVPHSFLDVFRGKKSVEEIKKEAKEKLNSISPAERRALEDRTLYYTYELDDKKIYSYSKDFSNPLKSVRHEPKLLTVQANMNETNTVYGYGTDEDMLRFVHMISISGYGEDLEVIRISKKNRKHFRHCTYIKDFLLQVSLIGISMHDELIKWNTGRMIYNVLEKMRFLKNYDEFDSEIVKDYKKLKTYYEENFKSICNYRNLDCYKDHFENSEHLVDHVISYLDKIGDLQTFIAENKEDKESIAQKALEYFNNSGIETAKAYDEEVYEVLQRVLKYIKPFEHLFNYVEVLTTPDKKIPEETKEEIRQFIAYKTGN
jgi:hypothetical protein